MKVGASEMDISTLPSNKYVAKHETKNNGDDTSSSSTPRKEQCCICLDEFKDGDDVKRLLLHFFHDKFPA